MQRPVMNPTFYDDSQPSSHGRRKIVKLLVAALRRVLRFAFALATYDPFTKIAGFRIEEGTAVTRAVRGLLYRLAFVPIFIAATACAIVYAATHPKPPPVAEVD